MATIICGSCKKSHSTVNEVKLCFTQNNNFIAETPKAPAKVVKKAATPVVKNYKVVTFNNKDEAEMFVENTPNSRLDGTVKVKSTSIWNEDTQSYQTVTTKTYTVIVKK